MPLLVKTSAGIEAPPATARLVTASPSIDVSAVVVKTFEENGNPLDAPFHLLVAR